MIRSENSVTLHNLENQLKALAVLLVCQVGRQEDAGDETVSDVFANHACANCASGEET